MFLNPGPKKKKKKYQVQLHVIVRDQVNAMESLILEVGNQGMGVEWGEVDAFQRATLSQQSGYKTFYQQREGGLHTEIAQSALTVIRKLVIGGLIHVTLIVLVQLIFSFRVGLFPFIWGQFSELWQLVMATKWPSCGSLLPVGFQYL